MIKLVYRNDVGKLEIPQEVLPANGLPHKHHFLSTDADNLIELAGRVCYDSAASEKTRATPEYHQHINDVNHGSVQEHQSLVFQFQPLGEMDTLLTLCSCLNRPGTYATVLLDENKQRCVRITANLRAIKEWNHFLPNNFVMESLTAQRVGDALKVAACKIYPLALGTFTVWNGNPLNPTIEKPTLPEETWLSFYTHGISRGLTHELVRHKYHTAVSQRSTRYVDEAGSDWAWHPLILDASEKEVEDVQPSLRDVEDFASEGYQEWCQFIEKRLLAKGIDKLTARKQARGAARGILGNALSTELIWSASLDEIKRVISQRANEHADGEIRLWANHLYEIVRPLYPDYFAAETKPCPDGIGFGVYFK